MKILVQIECADGQQADAVRRSAEVVMNQGGYPPRHRALGDLMGDALRPAKTGWKDGTRVLQDPDQQEVLRTSSAQSRVVLVGLTDLGREQKLEAIKALRSLSGFGLKLAKDAVEALNPGGAGFVKAQVAVAKGKAMLTFPYHDTQNLQVLGEYFFFVVVPDEDRPTTEGSGSGE